MNYTLMCKAATAALTVFALAPSASAATYACSSNSGLALTITEMEDWPKSERVPPRKRANVVLEDGGSKIAFTGTFRSSFSPLYQHTEYTLVGPNDEPVSLSLTFKMFCGRAGCDDIFPGQLNHIGKAKLVLPEATHVFSCESVVD